ncbi:hypothetical protein QAD02_013242 [Eretmocerus hayati]|uniref:Uncharacterized protein n=1 Tax=Eretmocerus hayati TaxID=131215 RepID=A0ACC2P1J9_9HYME|nr:hypothetical protein QAD02_013242 [Eretmocerus hayati]
MGNESHICIHFLDSSGKKKRTEQLQSYEWRRVSKDSQVLPGESKITINLHNEMKPKLEVLAHLLSREDDEDDLFVIMVLKSWNQNHGESLEELLASLLKHRFSTPSPGKRKRTGIRCIQSPVAPTREQILGHLDKFRQHCILSSDMRLFHSEKMQRALNHVHSTLSDRLMKSHGSLFDVFERSHENQSTDQTPHIPTRKQAECFLAPSVKIGMKRCSLTLRDKSIAKKGSTKERIADHSDQSSEEDSTTHPIKQIKKRKKMTLVGSDSD